MPDELAAMQAVRAKRPSVSTRATRLNGETRFGAASRVRPIRPAANLRGAAALRRDQAVSLRSRRGRHDAHRPQTGPAAFAARVERGGDGVHRADWMAERNGRPVRSDVGLAAAELRDSSIRPRRRGNGVGAVVRTVRSSDATHRSPQGGNKAAEPVVRGVLPARAGVDPVQTTAKARPHFELRATATAGLVGNVIG